MRNFTKAVITSLALTAGVAGAANAANNWPGNTSNVCGGDKFNTCASINLTWTGFVATLTATNLGTKGEVWDAIGLFNLPKCWGTGGNCQGNNVNWTYALTSGPANFVAGNQGFSGSGIVAAAAAANVPTNPSANGIPNGQGGTWVFTFSGFFTQAQFDAALNAAGVGIHAVSGPNGCSTKLAVEPNGTAFQDVTDPACVPVTSTPEPASVALLATGLVGLVGASAFRRRKLNKVS
jgi:hypothetical protein